MTHDEAKRKYDALRRMTTARGCTTHEAATAQKLADALGKKFGFVEPPQTSQYRPDFDSRFHRTEKRAAKHYGWEYRKCGKPNCWCAFSPAAGHGPYKYRKERRGRRVVSVYLGK